MGMKKQKLYEPPAKIIKNYADVLIKFALNSGAGVKPGEVVYCVVPDWAKPMYGALQESILAAGAHPMMRYIPMGFEKDFFLQASEEQITFFPKKFNHALVDTIDHRVVILPLEEPHGLEGVSPKKILARAKSAQKLREWLNDKEAAGMLTWTLAFWGTEEYAKESGMTLTEYWEQIISACYLNDPDPVASWKKTAAEVERVRTTLQKLPINRLHMTAKGTDLWITLGEKRAWRGGSGRNIPSYEVFTSPDRRYTEGHITFNEPLFYNGVRVENIRLTFEKGKVVQADADTNEHIIREMLDQPNAAYIGEFSLTDSRLSRITKPMSNTLFDENMGGRFGNSHIAVGMSYKDAYDGDPATVTPAEWERLGFNDPNCSVHTDMIMTVDRTVEAELKDGSKKIIYRDGKFVI
jgi:aminopeptidase